MSRDSWKPFVRSLAVALVAVALAAGFAVAQVADPEGDADVPCVDLVSVDVTSTTTSLDVTATMSPRPYPPEYVIDGVDDPNEIRLCPGGLYEVLLDTNGDGEADQRLRLFFDYHGEATVAGPDSLQVDYSIRHGEVTWHLDLADLDLEELPATIGLRVETQVVNDGSFKPLVDVDAEDSFPDTWQDVIVGAAAARLIGPEGGTVAVPDDDPELGGTLLEVPEGALDTIMSVNIDHGKQESPRGDWLNFRSPVSIGPDGVMFSRPAILHYRLNGVENVGTEEDWSFYRYDPNEGWLVVDEDPYLENAEGEPGQQELLTGLALGLAVAAAGYELVPAKARCLYYDDQQATWEDVSTLVSPAFDHEPVILVHGFQLVGDSVKICGPAADPNDTFGQLAPMLSAKGVPVFALTYHTGSRIQKSAESLNNCLQAINSFSPTRHSRIIAHSQGGLVSREFLELHRDGTKVHSVSRYMTLATPHQGTDIGKTAPCIGGQQMDPCGSFLEGEEGLNRSWRDHGLLDLAGTREPEYWILGADHDHVVARDSSFGMRCEDAGEKWNFDITNLVHNPKCADAYNMVPTGVMCRLSASCYDYGDNVAYDPLGCPDSFDGYFSDPLPSLFPENDRRVTMSLLENTCHSSGTNPIPIARVNDTNHPSWCYICRFATDRWCVEDGCPAPGVHFRDDFENGLEKWDPYGSPKPRWIEHLYGRDGVFDNNGDSWCNSEGVSKETFDLEPPFTLEGEVFLTDPNERGCWQGALVGLSDRLQSDGVCAGQQWFVSIGIRFEYHGDACWGTPSQYRRHAWAKAVYEGTDGQRHANGYSFVADEYLGGWHVLKIVVDEDGIPSFFIDDALVYRGSVPYDFESFANQRIVIGERSSGSAGKAYHDWVELTSRAETP